MSLHLFMNSFRRLTDTDSDCLLRDVSNPLPLAAAVASDCPIRDVSSASEGQARLVHRYVRAAAHRSSAVVTACLAKRERRRCT
jgi:hypothetical protein